MACNVSYNAWYSRFVHKLQPTSFNPYVKVKANIEPKSKVSFQTQAIYGGMLSVACQQTFLSTRFFARVTRIFVCKQ